MIRTAFNGSWQVAEKRPLFAAFAGVGWPGSTVDLPYDAMRNLDRDPATANSSHTGYFPGSHMIYEKVFYVPNDWRDKSATIEFEAVYRDAVVFVNDNYVTQRPSGYSVFAAVIDPYLIYGADNTIRVEARSHQDGRWYTGTGIHRDVWLLLSNLVHVSRNGVRVTTPEVEHALATVSTEVTVENGSRHTRTVRVASKVTNPGGTAVGTATAPLTILPGTTAKVHLRHYVAEPQLWSVDQPNLYRLDVHLTDGAVMLDETVADFGIRTIQLDPRNGLRINGQTVKLRGGCVHHDNGPMGSAAIARADERRVEILKGAGYNAIRSAHNPISRATLDACDRLGMLVIDEFSDVWTEGKTSFDYSLNFAEWWERDAESIVAKDFNHPSVIMYSIGNEIFEVGRPIGSTLGRALAEKFRELDGTRFVTNAINGLVAAFDLVVEATSSGSDQSTDVNTMIAAMGDMMNHFGASEPVSDRTEESHSQLDASGINYAEARYDVDAERHPDRVLYGSETFPGALDRLWPLVEKHPQVIGDFAWTAWDYLGESGVGRAVYADDPVQPNGISSPYPWLAAGCGTVDFTGRRRPISYWREVVWGLRAEPYIAVHRPQNFDRSISVGPWSWDDVLNSWTWDVAAGAPVRVDVYADADEVELLLDGATLGRAEVGAEKSFIARFITTYVPGALTAVAYRGGTEMGRTELNSVSGDLGLNAVADRTEIRADASDLAFVDIDIRDAEGVVANDGSARVTVAVEGPGTLAGFTSAQPDSEERFDADTRTTFDGRVLAVIRPRAAGKITVTASAEGFDPAAVEIVAR